MRLKNINGREVSVSTAKYAIKWEGKSRSKVQRATKMFLKPYWQCCLVCEEFPVVGTRQTVDIINFNYKIAIEVQGKQHDTYNKFFHGKNTRTEWLSSIKRDNKKALWLERNGFVLCEIYEWEVKDLTPEFFLQKFNVVLK